MKNGVISAIVAVVFTVSGAYLFNTATIWYQKYQAQQAYWKAHGEHKDQH